MQGEAQGEQGEDGSTADPSHGWLRAIVRRVDQVAEVGGWIAARLIAVIFAVGILNVVLRYYGRTSQQQLVSNFWVDTQWQLYGLAFLLGFPYAMKHQLNPRVDFFHTRFSIRTKALIDLVGHTLLMLPFTILAIRVTWPFAATAMGRSFSGEWSTWRLWQVWETSANPDGLPVGPIKLALVVGFALLALQTVVEILRNLLVVLDGRAEDLFDDDAPVRVE